MRVEGASLDPLSILQTAKLCDQAIDASSDPVVATHHGLRMINDIPRNIPEALLKKLAKTMLGSDWDKTYGVTSSLYVTRTNNILFTVMAQFARPVTTGIYFQPLTDITGALLARIERQLPVGFAMHPLGQRERIFTANEIQIGGALTGNT